MTWSQLIEELDFWARAGEVATFWWRDDDAVSDSKQLDVFLHCTSIVPVAMAVVPKLVDQTLADKLRRYNSVTVLQHGWRHHNYSLNGPSNEYPAGRNQDEVATEFSAGRRLLKNLFGSQSLPVFAPPWHGFDESYNLLLSNAGLKAISRKGPRTSISSSELKISNVHCVPIVWSDPPSFSSDDDCLVSILEHLRGRREKRFDPAEPTGILTHHLVQNTRSYEFMSKLITTTLQHSAASWLDARKVFAL